MRGVSRIPHNLSRNSYKVSCSEEQENFTKEFNNNCRYFLGATALTIAGALLGMIGAPKAKSSQMTLADATALPSNPPPR